MAGLPRHSRGCLFALVFTTTCAPLALGDRCEVRDFGATGDGVTLDTRAINRAIRTARCSVVVLSPGRYLTGTVRLKSHLVLEVEHGATILRQSPT